MDPKDLANNHDAVFGGFALRGTTFAVNSWGLNVINTGFQDMKRKLHNVEAQLIRGALRLWMLNGRGKTYKTEEIVKSSEKAKHESDATKWEWT